VLVIGPNGEQLGKMPSRQANELAASYNLDLFCVAPNANPPVCKILNYGKYRFEQQKQERISKRNQHVAETKQIQLHPNIGIHDLETKAHHAHDFLEEGDKVQVSVVFKGREMAHQEIGEDVDEEVHGPHERRRHHRKSPLLGRQMVQRRSCSQSQEIKEEFSMPKMKSKRALMKRVKVTGSGALKRKHAYMGHLPRIRRTKKDVSYVRADWSTRPIMAASSI
jgi:translation initiation factor IF-3